MFAKSMYVIVFSDLCISYICDGHNYVVIVALIVLVKEIVLSVF